MSPESSDVERLLAAMKNGDVASRERLFGLLYAELRGLAHRRLGNGPYHSIQATELVGEAYMRMVGKDQLGCENRRHFFAVAARAMQDILVERARKKATRKRGGGLRRVELEASMAFVDENPEEYLMLSDAISRLSEQDALSAEVVRLRFFAGFTGDETAQVLAVAPATVDRRWQYAKAWLHDALFEGEVK